MSEIQLHQPNPDEVIDAEKEREEQARDLANRGVTILKKLESLGRAKRSADHKSFAGGSLALDVVSMDSEPFTYEDGSTLKLKAVSTTETKKELPTGVGYETSTSDTSIRLEVYKKSEKWGDPKLDQSSPFIDASSSPSDAFVEGYDLDDPSGQPGRGVPEMQEADAAGQLNRIISFVESQPAQ